MACARADDAFAPIEAPVRARTAELTQAELARRLGTTQSAVARLEGGRASPSFATLRRCSEAAGTRPATLVDYRRNEQTDRQETSP